MRSVLGWVALASFCAGLCVEISQRYRTVLGILGLLVSLLGASYFLWPTDARSPEQTTEPEDLHEKLVADMCQRMRPMAAAALVGVLHEYRIVPARREWSWCDALELRHAISLVARSSGLPAEQIGRLYRRHCVVLRRKIAPELVAALSSHPLVERLVEYPDVA